MILQQSLLFLSALGELWLNSHSFSEPLNSGEFLSNWDIQGSSAVDLNGLSIVGSQQEGMGGLAISKNNMETDSFRIVASFKVTGEGSEASTNTYEGDPGFAISIVPPGYENIAGQVGSFYGFNPSLPTYSVYFAITSRDGSFKPSVSYGAKQHAPIQTPQAKGIYWGFVEKEDFECLIEVNGGRALSGFVRRFNTDTWTRAFEVELQDPIVPNSKICISGMNTTNSHAVFVKSFQAVSTDPNNAGFKRADPHADHLQQIRETREKFEGDNVVNDINMQELKADVKFIQDTLVEMSKMQLDSISLNKQLQEEQRVHYQQVMSAIGSVLNEVRESNENGADSEAIQTGLQQIEKVIADHGRSINSVEARFKSDRRNLESSVNKVHSFFEDFEKNSGESTYTIVITGTLVTLVAAIGYVITYMKRLEKKHIL